MKKTVALLAMIAGVSFGGIPIQWDVKVGYDQRFNDSSPVAYNITAMRGETLDLMPRYMASGYPFSIAANSSVRVYMRQWGTTNAFTVSATSGTVYTTTANLGRVCAVLLPSDIPVTNTNQFFVGIETSGMVYRAYGKLTLLDSPGVIASTNQIARGVFDSGVFTFANSHLAPWLLLADIGNYCGVQSVNGLTGDVSITAQSLGAITNVPPQSYEIITNSPWAYAANTASITITNGLASSVYVDESIAAILTSAPPQSVVSVNGQTGAVVITAAGIGALTNETDLAALRLYHYGSPDIVESPTNWFVFNGAGTITAFNWAEGRTNVVIPWAIGGVPVTAIGEFAFSPDYEGIEITSVVAPKVTTIGDGAFANCSALTSVSLPQATTIGGSAFFDCPDLTSVYFDSSAPTIGTNIFAEIPANQVTNYVTNPQATGWGATLGGMPVVRLPLYGDRIYQTGELVATTGHVAQAIAAIPEPDLSDRPTFAQIAASNALPYTAWTGTVTPADGTATVAIAHGNMPVLVTSAPCVLTLDPTGYGTAGVSRVSLSYYTGTNSFTFATNIITYSATPNVDTNGWNSLLIRRVSDGAWKGVGL